MAGSMKDIKLRIRSVESTMQITKAMELVASSKLRRAKDRADSTRPYYQQIYRVLCDIARSNTDYSSPYTAHREVKKRCMIVIAGDRGLAGGFNNNLFKAVAAAGGENGCVLPVGRKALDYYTRRGTEIVTDACNNAEHTTISSCREIARIVCDGFLKGEFDAVSIAYTAFKSMLSQSPRIIDILPLDQLRQDVENVPEGEQAHSRDLTLYEPNTEEVFKALIYDVLAGMVCGTVRESYASEQAARRMAMDSASKNAGEMIEHLNLYYNRARQAAITQEITEIVAGAEA